MTRPLAVDPERIALAGDWHGNLGYALCQVVRAHAAGADVVVQLGDFGFWVLDPATRKYLRRLEDKLSELGLHLLWVDGNHEDHDRLDAKPVDSQTGLRQISDHVHHLPRGVRWEWAGHTWLGLGGAVSSDRSRRRQGRDWWRQESLSFSDAERATARGSVDVMVTHDCPAGVDVPGLHGPSRYQGDVLEVAHDHRALLRGVVDSVRPAHLWHGHYHVCYDARLQLGQAQGESSGDRFVAVHGLGCDQGPWRSNLALAGADGGQ